MEYFDICDENGLPTGQTVSREEAHRLGIRHRTAHVWIVREREGRTEVLLQKRSMEKDSYPGLWDTSSAGHIPAGDEPRESALRELSEELGIAAAPADLTEIGLFRIEYAEPFHGKLFHDNEVAKVYLYGKPVDETALTLQESEVDAVGWFDLAAVRNEIRNDRSRFCMPAEGLEILWTWVQAHPPA